MQIELQCESCWKTDLTGKRILLSDLWNRKEEE